jgi:alcohol dehydrogenase
VVIACDLSDARLAIAPKFGATYLVKAEELAAKARELTANRGADVAIELSGSPNAAKLSLNVLRVGGTAVWVGAVSPTLAVAVEPEAIVRRCLTIAGVHNYAPEDLATAIDFLAATHTRFPFADLVAQTFHLERAEDAFRFAETHSPVRVGIACE